MARVVRDYRVTADVNVNGPLHANAARVVVRTDDRGCYYWYDGFATPIPVEECMTLLRRMQGHRDLRHSSLFRYLPSVSS